MNHPVIIFIAGPPRSGTTLLNRIMSGCVELGRFLPECTYLTKEIEHYANILLYSDEERFGTYFGNEENLRKCFQQIIDAHLITLIANAGIDVSSVLILKDPVLGLYVDQAIKIFPDDTKFIITIRDPRDVLASMKNVRAKQKKKWDVVSESTDVFNYYYKPRLAADGKPDAIHFIKYEEIVESKFDELSSFLGVEIKENLSTDGNSRLAINKDDPFYSPLYDKPIQRGRVGSYKKMLNRRELRHISRVFSGVMAHWGYE